MSRWLIVAVGIAYVYVAAESAVQGKMGLSLLYAGYAFANIGAWMLADG